MSIAGKYVIATLAVSLAMFTMAIGIAQGPTYANVPYVTGGGVRQQLDIYLPPNYREGNKLPVLVWVHGGGWHQGDKNNMPGRVFVEHGYALVSINYRLSQQAIFPAQIEDCKAVIRWLRANAEKYNLDPDRIGVWGASAGGHLVALLGTTNHKRDFDVGENLDYSSAVQAVCAIYGPMDFPFFVSTILANVPEAATNSDNVLARLFGGPLAEKEELIAWASPMTHLTKESPPFLLLHGTEDNAVPLDQSTRFYDALKKAGVEAEIVIKEGAGHDRNVFTTPDMLRRIAEFFDRHLKKVPAN